MDMRPARDRLGESQETKVPIRRLIPASRRNHGIKFKQNHTVVVAV